MAVDPNIYGLSISLELDAAIAFDTLGRFEQSLVGVEQNIADTAQRSLKQIDAMVSKIETSLGGLVGTLGSMNVESDKLAKAMAYAGVNVDDLGSDVESQIKNLIKARDFWEEIRDFNEEVADFAQDELETTSSYIKALNNIIKTVETKNKGHEDELGLVSSELPLVDNLEQSWRNTGDAVDGARGRTTSLFNAMRQVFDLLLEFDKETDNFTEANYRLVGSQQEIVNMTRHLSAETGIYRAEAIQAYKALADVKYPLEQMDKMAEQVGKLNVITGVGIDTIVQYSHAMRQTGIDADGTIMQLNRMAAAQRVLGLSTYDTNRIMRDAANSTASQIAMFGKDAPEAFQKAAMGLAAIGKETGMAAEQQQEWMKTLQLTGVEAITFWGDLGNLSDAEMQDVNARYNAMSTAVANFAEAASMSIEDLATASKNPDLQEELKSVVDVYGVTVEQMSAMAQAQMSLTNEQKAGLLTMEGLNELLRDEIALNRVWAETLQTLSRQWEALKARIMGVIGPFIQMAADSLIVLFQALNWVVGAVEQLITWGRILISWLESTIPGFSMITTAVKYAAGAFIVFAGAILLIGGLGGLLGGFFRMAASGIQTIGSAIGGALANLGNAVRNVMLPLLALGAAFLMVGAGAYLFATSVAIVAQQGWAAIPALLGMVLAVGLLGAILVGLAMLAQGPVALGLLAVAAALLAVGATVWMIGAGFRLMAEAANILTTSIIQLTTSGAIGDFATQLLGASWKILFAAPILAAAAVILVPAAIALGVAGMLLAVATTIFSYAIGSLGDAGTKFKEGMQALLDGTLLMAQIDFGALLSGAVGLLKAGFILGMAAIVFTPAALGIGVAGVILGYGLKSLSEGAMLASQIDFTAMARNLLYGSSILVWVGPIMLAGAVMLLPAGLALMVAGLALWAGAFGINKAAELLVGVGDKLFDAALKIGQAAVPLSAALVALVPAAFAALFTGPALLLGATSMLPGATALMVAGFMISLGSKYLSEGAKILGVAVGLIAEASMKLLNVSDDVLISASALAIGAGILFIGSSVLLYSSGLLALAGIALLPAAVSLYAGMFWLSGAINKLGRIAPDLHAISHSMWMLATSFILMGSMNFGTLTNLADAGLAAIPKINTFATKLDIVANKLSASVNRLSDPAERLIQLLGSVQSSVNSLDLQGVGLESDVSQMGQELEKYATALEAAAIRVETAIATKALPAIDEANAAGVSDIARSEAITTVQVMDKREGGVRDAGQDAQQQQVILLTKIVELVTSLVSPENQNAAAAILELLEEYLPEISDSDTGLNNSSMSRWTK